MPSRSLWPSMALPKLLLVQLLQVRLRFGGDERPSSGEPVSMSCWFGVSPRTLVGSPFSLSPFALLICELVWRSSTFLAISTPLALTHGPLPMRSRALTPGWVGVELVLRYARHVLPPAPTAVASFWQCASAPARPPRPP